MSIILDSMYNVWRSEMGDPDPLGWITTVAYFLVAALCMRTALAARRTPADVPETDRPSTWWLLTAGLLLLGLNKQLDLQIFVREIGIRSIKSLGLDAERRWFGRAFVLLLGLFLLRVLIAAARRVRFHTRGHRMLLTGLALLACFAVVRAGTYVPGLRQVNLHFGKVLHLVFELGGLVVVGASAWTTRQRLVRHQSSSISSA